MEAATEKIVHVKDTTEPTPELVEKYQKCYEKFVKMYPALKDVYKII